MRSIPVAMTWEMLSRGRWSLIGMALAANAVPALVLSALHLKGALEPGDQSQVTMQMLIVQINMFVFAAGVFVAQGGPARLFAIPVASPTLVTWRMFPAMAIVSLETLVSTAALNAIFDLAWPLWGPALFVAAAVAAVQATFLFCDKSTWLIWAYGLVTMVLALWYRSRYGATFSSMGPTQMWSEVTPFEVLTLLAFVAISWYLGVVGVARSRRGDALASLGILAWLERVFDPTLKTGQMFRTPVEAQSWLEWQRKGGAMPAGVVFCLILGVSGWLIFNRDPQDLLLGFVAGGGLLSVLGLVIGLMMGNVGANDAIFEMGHFRATRPMTSTEMARTILKTAGKSVCVAWSIWAAAFLALYLTLRATNSFPQQTLPKELIWWYFPATLLGPWIVVTALTSVGLIGRSQLFVQLLFALLTPFFGLAFLSSFLSRQANSQLIQGLAAGFGVVFVLGTAWAFVAAHRRLLIGSTTVYLGSSVWVMLSALVVLARVLDFVGSTAVFVFVIGLAALAVAPLATAPLAVMWNRNR